MIYLTRGKNLEGRILKLAKSLKKVQQYIKLMEDAGLEIIPPSIAINAGMYYQKQKDGRLALVYEANLKANPLVALNYKKEFDLLGLITKTIEGIKKAVHPKDEEAKKKLNRNKNNNNKIVEYFESVGTRSIRGNIDITGSILFENKIQYNFLTNNYSFTDKLGNFIFNAQNETIIKEQISFNAKIEGKYKGEFSFFTIQTKIEGKVNIEFQGSCGVKLKYGIDSKGGRGLFVAQSLYCSGVEGKYSGSLIGSTMFGARKLETNDGKPTPFTLIEPFEVPLFEIQMFKS